MRIKTFSHLLLAAATLALAAGCENALKESHNKLTAEARQDFDRQRLDIMFQVAEQQYKVGELAKCRESVAAALLIPTPHAPMRVLAARVELEGGNLDVAATHLTTALSIDPSKAEPLYLLGVTYQRWQKFDEACDYYEQASEKAPGEALYVLAVAEMRITLGRLDAARKLLEEKMPHFEQSAAMRVALARIATLQHDLSAATRHYRDATLLMPEDRNLRWTYAQSLYDTGKFSDAARVLEDLRRNPPSLAKSPGALTHPDPVEEGAREEAAVSVRISILTTLGECYVSLKRPADARDCFQEIIREQPDSVSAYVALGRACLLSNDLTMTAQAAQKALRFAPDNVPAMILKAAVLQKEDKWRESLETLNRAAIVSPRDSTVLCMKGISQLRLGQRAAAADTFQIALAVNPDDTWARELLGGLRPAAIAVPGRNTEGPVGDAAGLQVTPAETNTPLVVDPTGVTSAQPTSPDGQ